MQGERVSRERLVGDDKEVLRVSPKRQRKEFIIPIFNTNWTVIELSDKEMEIAYQENLNGYCCFDDEVISINSDRTLHRKGLALTHELLHALFETVGVDKDEALIRKIEHGVYELINKFPKEYKKVYER